MNVGESDVARDCRLRLQFCGPVPGLAEPFMTKSSRQQFDDYRGEIRSRDDLHIRHKPEDGDVRASSGRSFRELFSAFLGLLRGYRWAIAVALITLTVSTLLKLLPPLATKIAIDYVLSDNPIPAHWISEYGLPDNQYALLWLLAGGIVGTSVLATAIHLWGRWQATRTVNRVQVSLRKRVFEHAVRLPLHRVYELKAGGAASVLREDAGGAAELIFSMLYNPWRAIVQLVGSLLVLTLVDWRLLLGGILILPVVYFTHRTWIRRIRPLWRDVRKQRESIDATAAEAFGGMRIVRGFARERTEANRYVRSNDLLVRKQLFVWWSTRMIEIAWDLLIPMASTLLLVYGGYRILDQSLTLGDLMMFLFYLAMLLEPLATLVSSAASFQNNLAGLDRILDLLNEDPEIEIREDDQRIVPERTAGRIELRNISFAYPGQEQRVLSHVSFHVDAGETIALVGRSGAGKTTLCNLVARFYDPTEGQVLLDGNDLRHIRIDSYRRLLGIVEQDVFLFDGTIGENIRYGRRRATDEEMIDAAIAAHAEEFIQRLPDQYDTVIGERGVKLSGGQRQRLAIARALLADPKILILDEATSNLDSESELLIHESLQRLMQGRTCFVIAHRMSTIRLADRIVVLDDGDLMDVGTHDQLLATSQLYRRMVELQTVY